MPKDVPADEERPKEHAVAGEIKTAIEYILAIHKVEKELAIWRTLAIGSLLFVTGNVIVFMMILWKTLFS